MNRFRHETAVILKRLRGLPLGKPVSLVEWWGGIRNSAMPLYTAARYKRHFRLDGDIAYRLAKADDCTITRIL